MVFFRSRSRRPQSAAASEDASPPADVAPEAAAPELSPPEPTPSAAPVKPRRRRRGRSRAAAASEDTSAPADVAPEPVAPQAAIPEEAPEAPTKPRRRRRGRSRAAAAERRGTPASEATAEVAAPLPEAPGEPLPAPPSLDTLLERQTALTESLAQKQLVSLREIRRSLTEISDRLGERPQPITTLARVGIFVDVPNIVYAADRMGITIDFGRLLTYLSRGRQLVRASAYAPISDDPHLPLETQRFVAPFVRHGYRIVTKPLKRFGDGSTKANFDVELAIDVLTMADRLDVVCLVSGDGDFYRLVELVASRGVRVEVIAFAQSTAAELRALCDQYIELGQHLEELQP